MPNIVYTLEERIEMVRQHEQGTGYQRIVDHFAASYPQRPIPSTSTVRRIVTKFRQTGNVNPKLVKVSQPRKQLTEEQKFNIFLKVAEPGRKPARIIAQELDISKASVLRVLRQDKCHSFKLGRHQQLREGDPESRLFFCRAMMDRFNVDEGLLYRICFTDECTVERVSAPNRQNERIWAWTHPREFVESQTQWPEKLNLWLGLINDQLVGPFVIEGNLNGDKYLRLLRERIVPAVRAIEQDGPPIWYQQDGAPAHYRVDVREFLDEEFPNRWIGRLGPVLWPPRSPDLAPLDFGLWPYMKNKLYAGGPIADLPAMRARIMEIFGDLSPEMLRNMTNGFHNRVGDCIRVAGGHFEHNRRPRDEDE